MARIPGTDSRGGRFDDATIEAVWRKATPVPGALGIARDRCGATISRALYGERSTYGWEIDHIVPVSKGGGDALANLRPLHWRNNAAKGDALDGAWQCAQTT